MAEYYEVNLGRVVGPQGPKGDTGDQGKPGLAGADGKSAYQAAQEAGYVGTETEFNQALSNVSSIVPVSRGGTGRTSEVAALLALGVGYGTCNTSGSVAAKTVTASGFHLHTGAIIAVSFSNPNSSSSSVYLNVNGTGSKIVRNGFQNPSYVTYGMITNGVHLFVFDGTDWVILNPVGSVQLSAQLAADNWLSNPNGGFSQTVQVYGINSNDKAIVGLQMGVTTDISGNQTLIENFGLIHRVISGNNSITAYAFSEKPSVDLSLNLEVNRW